MKWEGRRQSDNVEDRRNQGSMGGGGFRVPVGGRGGGLSIGGVVVVLLVSWALGINPLTLLSGGDIDPGGGQSARTGQSRSAGEDRQYAFVTTVLADTEEMWGGIFRAAGQTYRKPVLVTFDNSTPSACGQASAATGPFYCPSDNKVYLDMAFFRQLERQFGAAGDAAQAYVVAHEVGHHVQNLTGVLPQFNQARARMSAVEANRMSVRVELQADCYAGIWGRFSDAQGVFERGDLEEALTAAHQIGDDALQKQAQGYVVPDSFNHGSSEQRMRWFKRGFDSGEVSACNTFDAPYERL